MKKFPVFVAITMALVLMEPVMAEIPDAPRQLGAHSYAWIGPLEGPDKINQGYRMNMGFVVGKTAVAVIDSGHTPAIAEGMVRHIRKITSTPIKYVVNTNSQPHRFMGNTVFEKLGATTIAHPVEAARMKTRGGDFAGAIERILELPKDSIPIPGPPGKLQDKPKTIDLGGVNIEIIPMPASHTASSLIVKVPRDKLVFAGDILYSGRLLAVLQESDVESWLKCLAELKKIGNVTFVPGHGEPARLTAFNYPTRDYLRHLNAFMIRMVDEGVALQDAINKLDQNKWKKLVNFDELAGRNASWTYLEKERKFFEQ